MATERTASADPEMDRRLMAVALRLGRRNLGSTAPAPAVGTLVVGFEAEGPVIVGRGATGDDGTSQAEIAALTAAGAAARGATVYTTLEPSPNPLDGVSAVEALISAGVARVISALENPDPRVAGRGHAQLRDAGIAVVTGVLGDEARRLHAGPISVLAAGRPHVTLKLAVSADGMIGRLAGERMLVSGREAFARLQTMRIEADATLIGIGTALVDDPSLTVRVPGLRAHSPIRIVLDTQARLSPTSSLVKGAGDTALWLVTSSEAPLSNRDRLAAAGVEVINVGTGSGGVDIEAALRLLAERGVTRLLVEGGAKVAASLLHRGLLDEVVLFHAPVVVGPDGVRALAGGALSAIERSPRFRRIEETRLGEDRMVRYERSV
ncbi:riboflavin biosynthesis protein RibD [Kaistia sp. 32K]|uniref:bifunctional diaminohydroxyphosphoribosylaminopyrimidine deaminase/5-amino-6-(5-phosphoribosylamino)uracil reductase RibD n=1 Tax=Kaistia sp. 32K TaxID=2795690 RepID=UPI0019371882|nr:bifunctional diaminohydroxyphosphoribosylaminopyrimidine deaminase/5-amino-6-(5-phosphoribosylamino)uracil reductase RibD [Kaistia sp. 32K]BCP53353.1 riboflavin biosynthesis protein RibD [Kaistia sp. 32K]